MTASADAWLVDTDIQIHRLGIDRNLRDAAEAKRVSRQPVAVSAYSLVEFKANYISDLHLLRRKIRDSGDIEQVFARVQASGGRKTQLMLAQLVKALLDAGFTVDPWESAQSVLITFVDGQLASLWHWFKTSVDRFIDDLDCTRAREEEAPRIERDHWIVARPDCRQANTRCRVVDLMKEHHGRLEALVADLKALGALTDELREIVRVLEVTLARRFPWEGKTCRSVGDLLIALHAQPRQGLISSNRAEHASLAPSLGYALDLLPIGGTRLT